MSLFDKAPKDASVPLREILKDADDKFVGAGGTKEKADRWTELLCDYVEAMADDIRDKNALMMLLEILGTCMVYHKAHQEYLENAGKKKPDGETAH